MIKNLLKKYFLYFKIKDRFSPAVQITQRQIFHDYQRMLRENTLPALTDTGFRVFSQFEEDGKLLCIFSLIGMDNKIFIELGSDDGINSNCANLYFNFGWYGLFIDANKKSIARGKRFYSKYPHAWYYKPDFAMAKVTTDNVNRIIGNAGYTGEVGLLSIDIDGNDYWIWKALDVVSPRVVIIETHVEFGMRNIVVPYDENYVYPGKHKLYHGASPFAMQRLAALKGYRLVGANELGFNLIFVRNDIGRDVLPEVTIGSVLQHPSVTKSQKGFEEIKDWEYVEG